MGSSTDGLHIADVSDTDTRDLSYLAAHINVLRGWQLCRTLVPPSGSHVVNRFTLKIRFLSESEPGSDKGVPPSFRLVAVQDERE